MEKDNISQYDVLLTLYQNEYQFIRECVGICYANGLHPNCKEDFVYNLVEEFGFDPDSVCPIEVKYEIH